MTEEVSLQVIIFESMPQIRMNGDKVDLILTTFFKAVSQFFFISRPPALRSVGRSVGWKMSDLDDLQTHVSQFINIRRLNASIDCATQEKGELSACFLPLLVERAKRKVDCYRKRSQ